jgi:hypothetical protein
MFFSDSVDIMNSLIQLGRSYPLYVEELFGNVCFGCVLMQAYSPEKLDVFHDYQGHQGTAVVTFRNDIHGLEDAQAFEQSFVAIGRGRKEWWHEQRPADMDLYGWQATEEVIHFLPLFSLEFI